MKNLDWKSLREGIYVCVLSLISCNTVCADSSSERLATYKANGLIPSNITINVGNNKDAEATFVSAQRTWATAENANLMFLFGSFAGWNLEDFQNYDWSDKEKNEAYFNYLTKVETGEIIPECAELTKDLAMDLKMACFKDYSLRGEVFANAPAFEFSGNEKLSDYGEGFSNADLSNCTGLKIEQLYDIRIGWSSKLPIFQIRGDEDFSRLSFLFMDLSPLKGLTVEHLFKLKQVGIISGDSRFANVHLNGSEDFSVATIGGDLSGWTGMTPAQCLQGLTKSDKISITWPSVTFNGTEDFSKASLRNLNFPKSNLKGITAEQIASSTSLIGATLPELDFSGIKGFTQEMTHTDLTRCTGLTAEQIISSKDWRGIRLTKAQYESMKTGLAASLPNGYPQYIYVDGKYTTIRGTN